MLIPKKVKTQVKAMIKQLVAEKQTKISEIKDKAYDYVYNRLPWWADLLFEKFVAKRIDKWINEQISEAVADADNN